MLTPKDNFPRQVINQALKLLDQESSWNKNSIYGEQCLLDANTYTLGCALETAQLKVRGKVVSRAPEINKVRRRILRHFFIRGHLHPITYFNRNKKTTYKEVLFILEESLEKLSN